MIIRKATADDIPAIVELLRESLGDVSSKKSVDYWNWKHVHNPFGASPVLVAEADGRLVGVRAMMRWNWEADGQVYRSLRAVDTATHPDYQGRGIFKKLTLVLVEEAKQKGIDFIFNTPNTQSKPGYLKMGWCEWGRMPLWIKPVLHFRKYNDSSWDTLYRNLKNANLDAFNGSFYSDQAGLHTPITSDWLKWRYQDCVVKSYGLFEIYRKGNKISLFVSPKPFRYGVELRIGTVLFSAGFDTELLSEAADVLAYETGSRMVSFSGFQSLNPVQVLLKGWCPVRFLSVPITVRWPQQEGRIPELLTLKKWLPQTGDLELF